MGSLTIHLALREGLQTNLKAPQLGVPKAFEVPKQ